ncbi:alpha-keto acid decarboxylase family protein [Rothia sp. LK2588]|uniref:alpha-keto acid decarboxylase family protein n=1 Tax=Rothia sp. LK2588 TaxID=3114369 RepID=UPI0034CFFDE3
MSSTYTIGHYLLDRLAELGLTELFGVPGDYNLHFLDTVISHDKIRWVGSANELNAGYSADGYARVRGIGALLTTFGVGELSAINAIAGAYTENVPVVHVVGAPSKEIQAAGRKVHHSLGDGDFEHFIRMADEVCCATSNLNAPTATWEIDRVLRSVMYAKQPGMIMLAADVAKTPCQPPSSALELITETTTDAAAQAFEDALRRFVPGKKATILADLLVHRLGATDELETLLAENRLPVGTLSWGKSLVNESSSQFIGIYSGSSSSPEVRAAVEDAEMLLSLGVEFTDNTTAGFSMQIDPARTVDLKAHVAKVGGETFTPLSLQRSMEILTKVLVENHTEGTAVEGEVQASATPDTSDAPLTQDNLWAQVTGALSSENIVVADQGTSYFGMSTHRLPAGAFFIGQPMWGSIGYTLPAMFGAGMADRSKRPILLIGDGAAQLTVQELGQVIREGLPAVIILVNNEGYTVERVIHGPEEQYNEIPTWRWELALPFFGAREEDSLVLRATTGRELAEALKVTADNPEKLVLLEVVTSYDDAPEELRKAVEGL